MNINEFIIETLLSNGDVKAAADVTGSTVKTVMRAYYDTMTNNRRLLANANVAIEVKRETIEQMKNLAGIITASEV